MTKIKYIFSGLLIKRIFGIAYSEAIVARENVNTTINRNVSLQITNRLWGNEGSWPLERGRNHKIDSGAMTAVGQPEPICQAAESFGVSRTTLKRLCREPGMPTWPLPKHDERTLGVTDSKLSRKSQPKQNLLQSSNGHVDLFGAVLLLVRIKRWSCSSKRHGCSGQWWSCGKHGYPPFKSDSIYQVARLMLSLKRWRRRYLTKHAMQKNDGLKKLTIKATYKENIVRFSFTRLDGLEKLKEMVATRFQLKPGSFKLKYEDKDGDNILIACDADLMGSVGDSKPPVNLTVLRLLVLSVAPESIDA